MTKPRVNYALITPDAAESVALFLGRMIDTHCPQGERLNWELVRDALFCLTNDTDFIVTSEDAAAHLPEVGTII